MKKINKNLYKFYRSGGISASIENVLAMLPSTVLMPIIINSTTGIGVFDISNVLLSAGICTLLFVFITEKGTPSFLGSSFAYIGVTCTICEMMKSYGNAEEIPSYIMGTYLFSALILFVLSLLCKLNEKKTHSVIDFLVPTSVLGPVISLIGLELSDQAMERAGLTGGSFGTEAAISLSLIGLFMLFSLIKRKFLKNASIFLSFCIVSAVCIFRGYWDISGILDNMNFMLPKTNASLVPKFNPAFLIMIIPPSFILFCEHIARKVMVENLKESLHDDAKNSSLSRSVFANSLAVGISAFFKGTPLTLYAENIAVMRLNSYTKILQFILAAAVVVFLSFNGPVIYLIQNIPDPIIGGLSVSLMGIIAVPGLKILIDRNVDYNRISNLLLTSAVLITGLSKVKITILSTEFKGMSLGLLTGIILNLAIKFISRMVKSKDTLSVTVICDMAENLEKGAILINKDEDGLYPQYDIFYGQRKKENLFLSVVEKNDTLIIKAATDESKETCIRLYSVFPDGEGFITIDGSKLHTEKKLLSVIKNSYEIIKNRLTFLGE